MLRYHKWTVREGIGGPLEGMGAAVYAVLPCSPPVPLQVGALWAGEYLNCETDPAALDFHLTYSPREGPPGMLLCLSGPTQSNLPPPPPLTQSTTCVPLPHPRTSSRRCSSPLPTM